MRQLDIELVDGRTLRAYDAGPDDALAVGQGPHGRVGGGRRRADRGRTPRIGARGHGASGGGPHALACAALLPGRVVAAACLASLAPRVGALDYFAGMASPGGLRAALDGRDARARYAETEEFDEASFTPADWAALAGPWSSLGADAGAAGAASPDGLIDDDVAFVAPWGFEVDVIEAPVLVVHGGEDRVVPPAHADWLVRHCPNPELWLRPRDGHVSVLNAAPLALDWLRQHA